MKRFTSFLVAAGRLAARMGAERSTRPLREVLARTREKLESPGEREVSSAVPNPDGKLLEDQIPTLNDLLAEIDELAASLPEDAQPISEAARLLVERALEECRKPIVDAARITRDMKEVGELASAMRERLLLSPRARRTMPS